MNIKSNTFNELNLTIENVNTLISICMVVHNDEDIITNVIHEVEEALLGRFLYYEILIIDNGSTDQSVQKIRDIQKISKNVRLLVMSRAYDMEAGFAAALDNSLGDFVVIMDIITDPPNYIPILLEKAFAGNDIVIAERKQRKEYSFIEKIFARLFYRLYAGISGFTFEVNEAYFRVLSRRVVNSIIQFKNKTRYLKFLNAFVGFKQTKILYENIERRPGGARKRGFWSSVSRAVDILISHTIVPLRLVSLLGMIASFCNLLFIAYVFVVSIIKTRVAEGWISTSVINSSMFFMIFLIFTVMSEYIIRILIESKDQPLYFIAEEFNSIVTHPLKDKINIV